MTAVGGRVCVFGGEDAPRNAFDPYPHLLQPDGAWERASEPAPGGAVLGHAAASLGSRLYAFGGRRGGPNTFSGDSEAGETDGLSAFDADSGAWASLEPAGTARPEPRSFHAMCAAGQRVFVFGGCGTAGRLNDLWSLDPQGGHWENLHPGGSEQDAPLPRGGSCLLADAEGSRLLLLFGFSGAQQGDIAIFDVPTRRWTLLPAEQQLGDVPTPRSVFAAAMAEGRGPRGTAVLFGGERVESDLGHAGAGEFAADLYALDADSLRWTALQPEGEVPAPRGWAGLAAPAADRMLLFGGLDTGNTRLGDAWELSLAE